MKFVVIVFALLAAVVAGELYTEEQLQTLKGYVKDCKESTHVTEDKLEQMRQRHFEDDQHLKDYIFCMGKKLKLINDANEVQKDNMKKLMAKSTVASEAMSHCIDKHGSSGPETSYIIYQCYLEHLPSDFKANF